MINLEHLKNYENMKHCFDFIINKNIAVNCLTFVDYKCFTENYEIYSNINIREFVIYDNIFNSKDNTYNHKNSLQIDNLFDRIIILNKEDFENLINHTVINFDNFLNLKNINDFCIKNNIEFNIYNLHRIEIFYFHYIKNNTKKIKNNDFGISI